MAKITREIDDGEYVFGTESCTILHNGVPIHMRRGEVWAAEDEFVKANPTRFGSTPPDEPRRTTEFGPAEHARRVERATRRPGERRG